MQTRTKRGLALAGAACAAFMGVSSASAAVAPADPFTFAVAGFNSASGVGYILGSGYSAIFGTTATIANAGYDGQAYTISSHEVIGATSTTDFFTVSTPTNFINENSVNGTRITALQFDLGDANSGVGVSGGADPVNLLLPITSYTATGDIIYGTGNSVFTLTPTVTLVNGGLAVTMAEGVNSGTTAISSLAVHQFDFSITYANPTAAVPEATTWAMMIAGFSLVGGALRSARRSGALQIA